MANDSLTSNSAVYEVQEGMDRDLNKQFRVTDTRTDSRVATCYVQSNADLVCAALNAYTADEPPAVDVAPIAKLTVRDGLVQRAGLYAPGLPDGDHDVFPVPLSPKGELRPHVLAEPPADARWKFIQDESLHLVPFAMPTGAGDADIGWRVLQSHMGKGDVVIAEVYRDRPAEAIDAARAALTKDAGECGACDKPGEHCANVHGICSRHGGRAHEKSAVPYAQTHAFEQSTVLPADVCGDCGSPRSAHETKGGQS